MSKELRLNPDLEEVFEKYRFKSTQTPPDIRRQLHQEIYAKMYDSMLQNILRVRKGNIEPKDMQILRAAVVPAFQRAIEGAKDELTGLPTKEMIVDITQRYMDLAKQIGGVVTFVYIDIDKFKEGVNDTHGHKAGDKFLRTFGGILQQIKRSYDVVGITKNEQQVEPGKTANGDEFGVVFYGSQEIPAQVLCDRISTELSKHSYLKGFDKIGVSMGIAKYQMGGKVLNASELIENADTAMYNAKRIPTPPTKVKFIEFFDNMQRPKDIKR